jgi:DNA-directed RNA polymerase subunit N (RpoN/RPB10)
MSEIIEVECPGCGETINVNMNEFVDVVENPEYKAAIVEGDFFLQHLSGLR